MNDKFNGSRSHPPAEPGAGRSSGKASNKRSVSQRVAVREDSGDETSGDDSDERLRAGKHQRRGVVGSGPVAIPRVNAAADLSARAKDHYSGAVDKALLQRVREQRGGNRRRK